MNNSLEIHQREIKQLETKLCPYLPQYLIYLLILNIHKVITPSFREINDGFSIVQDCMEKPRDFDPFGQTGWSPLATI